MRSLYESILDDQENILKKVNDELASKKFNDEMFVFGMYMATTDSIVVNIDEFIKWKEFSKEIKQRVLKDNWKFNNKYSNPGAAELECAFENQPLLGYEQNFLAYMRNFAKGDVLYSYRKSCGKDRFTYIFTGKNRDLEVEFSVKPR